MTMIEKVARALAAARDLDALSTGDFVHATYEEAAEGWAVFAREAVEAMREPSEGMKKALQDNIWPDRDGDIDRDQFGPAFTAAIDAALSETEG